MKSLILFSFIFLISAAFCEDLNASSNATLVNGSVSPWYMEYGNRFLSADNSGLIAIIIGLGLAYILGKIAFKFIKVTIIILLIILLLRIIF